MTRSAWEQRAVNHGGDGRVDFPYFWVSCGVVVLTAFWVAIDVRINRVPTYGERYDINTGAFCWFIALKEEIRRLNERGSWPST